MRIDKDQLGLVLAAAWAQRGTCARRRVGCVLMDDCGNELGTGYNGPPSGHPHCLDTGRKTDRACSGVGAASGTGLELCEAVHAEMNALIFCRDVSRVHTAYVTHSPCLHCVKLLMNSPCTRIVFAERYAHDEASMRLWLSGGGRSWEHVELRYAIGRLQT